MKNVEDRLKQLPQIAEESGLEATQQLQYRIRNAARDRMKGKRTVLRRLAPVLSLALVLAIGLAAFMPGLLQNRGEQVTPLSAQPAGEGETGQMRSALLDVPQGSLNISASQVPDYNSIWARGSGANFPLICAEGRYYRMLTTPKNVSSSLLGDALGQVSVFTQEPSLAGREGIVSNIVPEGETVYAVDGMKGAMAAAYVDGDLRVFQRVSFGDSALVGGDTLKDTLRCSRVVKIELSGVGAVTDGDTAENMLQVLYDNASFQRAGGGETSQALLIYLSNGLTVQMAVNGEKLIGCGTWACPEFFEEFMAAIGE